MPTALPTPRRIRPAQRPRFSDTRGAVLIVALLISALIAVGLASYLRLNVSSSRLANRTYQGFAALNVAEAGTEEAVWSFNRATAGDAAAWDAWTKSAGPAAWQKFTGFDFGRNSTGFVKVYVDNYDPGPTTGPKIIAQSTVSTPGEPAVLKMVEVTLRRRSMFANGLVARESIVFSGANASVDAWDSDPDRDPATAPVAYDPALRTARGTVASNAHVTGAISLNEAHIWGYVATGGGQPNVGPNGTIRGPETPVGVNVDPRRIATDFNADLPVIEGPTNGVNLATVPATLGTAGVATSWRTLSVALSGQSSLTIQGDVTLVLTAGPGVDALTVTGQAQIIIPVGSSLKVYTQGNVRIAGNGLANANAQPITFQLWGTSPSPGGQNVQIAGNGALRGVIYVPNGDVKVNGNGDVMGSIVAHSIALVGNAAFHYDEALAYGESNEPFAISRWRELSDVAERAPYLSVFEGW